MSENTFWLLIILIVALGIGGEKWLNHVEHIECLKHNAAEKCK